MYMCNQSVQPFVVFIGCKNPVPLVLFVDLVVARLYCMLALEAEMGEGSEQVIERASKQASEDGGTD